MNPDTYTNNIPHGKSSLTHVVGIGASAGGLEPIESFFANMPSDSGAAFVIVQHLSREFESLMAQLLTHHTDMPIQVAETGMVLQANHIYLNSAGQNLILSNGCLMVTDLEPSNELHLPIDIFFNSLAFEFRERAVAVILSGAGHDGSRGVKSIHQGGGFVLVQSPASASFDSMPNSSIDATQIDGILPPKEMPATVVELMNNGAATGRQTALDLAEATADSQQMATHSFYQVLDLLEGRFQIDFSNYKSVTLERRIERRMGLTNSADLTRYATLLSKNEEEQKDLYRDILVDVTQFFRDEPAFEILSQTIIPELVTNTPESDEIRIWVAACASGEEAYSVGIMLLEEMARQSKSCQIRIFATDAHQNSIDRASHGLFSKESCEAISAERLERFFTAVKDGYQVTKQLRTMMIFAHQDLLNSSPFTRLDLVTCRNALIYFEPEAQQRLLANFHFALKANGTLFLGPSEHLGGLEDEFGIIDRKWRIFRKLRDVILPTVHIAMPPMDMATQLPKHLFRPVSHVLQESAPEITGYPAAVSAPKREQSTAQGGPSNDETHNTGAYSTSTSNTSVAKSSVGLNRNPKIGRGNSDNWMESLLISLIPSGLVLDHRNNILYIFGDAQSYLHLRLGHGTLSAFDMLEGDLVLALRLATAQLIGGQEKVVIDRVNTTQTNGDEIVLRATVISLLSENEQPNRVFIGLEPLADELDNGQAKVIDMGAVPIERVEQLEYELAETQETLQATVEEQESTNEELSAANEELQASNEELSATNEELFTVNTEYQRTITTLTKLTTDMENLQSSSQIGVLFLEQDLSIRQFTPPAAELLGLVDADVGRSIALLTFFHLSIDMAEFTAITQEVMKSAEVRELETNLWNGSYYLLRILPYRDGNNQTEGVVLTILDISLRKEREQLLLENQQYFDVTAGIFFVLDLDARLTRINANGLALLGYSEEEMLGKNWFDVAWAEQGRSDRKERFGQFVRGEVPSSVGEHELLTKSGKRIAILATSALLNDSDGNVVGVAASGYDITEAKAAQNEVANQARFIKAITETTPNFIYVYSLEERRNVYLNRDLASELGYTVIEIQEMGESFLPMTMHPDDWATQEDHWNSVVNSNVGEVISREYRIRHKDGDWRWFFSQELAFRRTDDGTVTEILGSGSEITARKNAESAAIENERFLRNVFDASPTVLYIFDVVEQRNLFTSREDRNEIGYSVEELQSMGADLLPRLMHPDDYALRPLHYEALSAAQPGTAVYHEYRMKHRNGEWRWFASRDVVHERAADGTILKVLGSRQDITASKQAELALAQSQAQYKAVVDNQTQHIVRFRPDTYILTFANAAFCNYWKQDEREVLGKSIIEIVNPTNREAFQQPIQQVLATDKTQTIEQSRWLPGDGSKIWVRRILSPIHDQDGQIVEIQGIRTDITERKITELALAQSEAQYKAVVDTQTQYVIRYSADTFAITFANSAFCQYWGRQEQELLGVNIFDLMDPDTADKFGPLFEEVITTGATKTIELSELSPTDGSEVWIRRTLTPIADEHGKVVEIQGVGTDVTERKLAEIALEEQGALLQSVLDAMPDALLLSDTERTFTLANPAVERILGYAPDEIIGQTSRILYENDDMYFDVGARHYGPTATELLIPNVRTVRRKDGSSIVAEIVSNHVIKADGTTVGYLGVVRDITERKKTEENLQSVTSQLRTVIETIPARITFVDSNQRIRFANSHISGLTSQSTDLIEGQHVKELLGPELYESNREYINIALEGTPIVLEMQREAPDGPMIYEQVSLVPSIVNGNVEGYYSFVFDISELKNSTTKVEELNSQLQALNASLEERIHQRTLQLETTNHDLSQANAELEQFIYVVSHDLKEPLRRLQSYGHMLSDSLGKTIDEDATLLLSKMAHLTLRTEQMIEALGSYSRVGLTDNAAEEVDLELIIDDVAVVLQSIIAEERVELIRKAPLPSVTYSPAHLMTIFQNLIANAIKYNMSDIKQIEIGVLEGEGEEVRTLSNSRDVQPNIDDSSPGNPVIYIRDNGIGIQDSHYDRIFEMFKRLHPEQSDGGGTGAGLALVKRIIEQNGGQIWVESEVDQGTVFYLKL